jgi:hypothetical protein
MRHRAGRRLGSDTRCGALIGFPASRGSVLHAGTLHASSLPKCSLLALSQSIPYPAHAPHGRCCRCRVYADVP